MKTLFLSILVGLGAITPAHAQTWQHPFTATSPWNTRIGAGAMFVPANLRPAGWMTIDEEIFLVTKASDPLRTVYKPQAWDHRCGGHDEQGLELQLPDSFIIPDAVPGHTPNNVAAFLLADGQTIVQVNPIARCDPAGPLYGWQAPTVTLDSDGIQGGHGGSGLSSIGGSIRRGELTAAGPIVHALKVNIWGAKYLWKFADGDSGFRWPAWRHDGCAPECYGGTNPSLRLGSLLALPRTVADTLHLETIPGGKIRDALRDYGAYVVDDTAWDAYALCVESDVRAEFRARYSLAIEGQSGPWYRDMMKLYGALMIVDNNSPTSVGGGAPR